MPPTPLLEGGGVDMEKETLINYRKLGLYLDICIVYIYSISFVHLYT